MEELSFDLIAAAWKRLINDADKLTAMQTQAPSLVYPTAIRLKNTGGDEQSIQLQFYGFEAASDNSQGVPIIKRMLLNWVKQFAETVQVMGSTNTDLNLVISKQAKFTEAAISVYRRNPKTNKITRVHRCMGGAKNGRKVSDPQDCLSYPDVQKKISLSISKRAKYGQAAEHKLKTRLTNIVSKRVRKINQRMKKARGF